MGFFFFPLLTGLRGWVGAGDGGHHRQAFSRGSGEPGVQAVSCRGFIRAERPGGHSWRQVSHVRLVLSVGGARTCVK